ncbi:hypothetical protein [Epilithonimonas tenax]|uniref:hypothetical protein n=1 Tax=Epilithonimonas tenax TaxID=191577 RepID=UPI000415620A|nr:hypothetical protein [Epilithonimonas tenax]
MTKKHFILLAFLGSTFSFGQVGINTSEPKATLDIVGSPLNNSKTDGIIAPRLSGDQLKAKDELYKQTTPTVTGHTGTILYVTEAVTGTPSGKTINVTETGYFYFDGLVWKKLNDSKASSAGSNYANSKPGAVKIAVNQSGFLTLNGTQSYGLLMQNSPNTSVSPTYVTGVYPGGTTGSPTDVISSTKGSNGYALLEAPINMNGNIFRLNMEYVMGNNPPSATRYFNVKIESIGTGALIYENAIVVPGGMDTGHVAPFQILFPTIADASSIGIGYRIVFRVDTAASSGLQNNIGIKIIDIARLNQ